MAVQAALSLAGASLGLDRLADLRPVSVARVDDHRWRVELGRPGGTVAVEVEQRLGPESSRLTCHAEAEHPVPSWHLLSLAADGSGSGVG
jgi:hypothetical protein